MGQNKLLDQRLRRAYQDLPNVKFHGFVDQFNSDALVEVLAKSWVLINTSVRESLPTTFVEAAGHGCAILSAIDPDDFASDFGYRVSDGDYAKGLRVLLERNAWRHKGELGMAYVRETFSLDRSMQGHLQIYQALMQS